MRIKTKIQRSLMESVVLTGISLAAFYWVCESFMYFFLAPEANFIHHLLGPDMFETWTRVLVLCIFAIFGSHVQYNFNNRKRAYEKLREQDEKYRTIIENIEEGFFEVDLTGKLTFFNNSVSKILGYSPQELLGMDNRNYTRPGHAKKMFDIMNKVYTTGEPSKVTDFEVIRKDGNTVTVEMNAYLMRDQEGNPSGFRGVVRDVSERLVAEREKRKLEIQLQQAQKMEAIGNLAGGIAHDFNNILMGMQGNTSLMLLNIDKSHPHYDKLKSIENYIENGAALTRQLLGFARGGKYEVKATDLNGLIQKTARMFGRTKKEIKIHTSQLREIWNVEIDQSQIEQVLLNIFVNAWHAMPDGGDLHLMTENVVIDDDFGKPFHTEPGKYVKISIIDTGVGMDKNTQQRIFEPFFTTKGLGRGTGLGLASAYGIVKNHGGFIDVFSEPGEGATFSIYLPASEKEVIEEADTFEQVLKGSETVLLVDDEEMIIDVGQEILKTLGYKVLLAMSGKEALEIYENKKDSIAMVILDMIMPGMGGGETYDNLKLIDPDIKVLLSSGYSISGQAAEILERGCDGFIQKPFKLRQLSAKIREVLDQD
ncbi:MAG: PAS domain S-box protein [Deltaproteobacteria bacterium]|nr:MAG: PAS domain S-box protein [Deltaproteobacteria bacterium]